MKDLESIKLNYAKNMYNTLCDELSLKQYSKLMGGSMLYIDKATLAKKLFKSKNVQYCANVILFILNNDGSGLDQLQKHNINNHLQSRLS
jgi:hypothetical protein